MLLPLGRRRFFLCLSILSSVRSLKLTEVLLLLEKGLQIMTVLGRRRRQTVLIVQVYFRFSSASIAFRVGNEAQAKR